MKTKLTIAKIETAKVPSGQTETKLWDSLVNGLYLRISASGGRRWYFRYRNDHGKVRPLKVGDYPALSIDAARDAAKVHAAAVAKGRDPGAGTSGKAPQRESHAGLAARRRGALRAQSQRSRHRQLKATSVLPAARAQAPAWNTDIAKLARRSTSSTRSTRLKECPAHTRNSASTPALSRMDDQRRPRRPHNVLAGIASAAEDPRAATQEAARRRALDDADIVTVWRAAEGSGHSAR